MRDQGWLRFTNFRFMRHPCRQRLLHLIGRRSFVPSWFPLLRFRSFRGRGRTSLRSSSADVTAAHFGAGQLRQAAGRGLHLGAVVRLEDAADPAGDQRLNDALQQAAGDPADARHRLQQRADRRTQARVPPPTRRASPQGSCRAGRASRRPSRRVDRSACRRAARSSAIFTSTPLPIARSSSGTGLAAAAPPAAHM